MVKGRATDAPPWRTRRESGAGGGAIRPRLTGPRFPAPARDS